MGMNANFTFWKGTDSDSIKCQKAGAAEAIINNFKGHRGNGEKAVIPTSLFDKNIDAKDLDTDENGEVDRDEVISLLEKMDKKDGENGKISSATAASDDKFDLLGFKSGQTKTLQEKSILTSTEKGLGTLNQWAGNSAAMLFGGKTIVNEMGNKASIDYITTHPTTQKLLVQTKGLNPDLVKDVYIKAYGETDGPQKFNELH